jgi:hypothetical protein
MADSDESDGPDEDPPYRVGYGRPPKARQFQKGRSGNPRGRPKGSKSFATIVREEQSKTIQVKIDGKMRSVPLGQAILMRMLREGVAGSRRASDQGLRLMERYGLAEEPPEQTFDLTVFTDKELNEWGRLLYKASGQEAEFHAEREAARAERIRIFGPGVVEHDDDDAD